jgi:hypothetical protein
VNFFDYLQLFLTTFNHLQLSSTTVDSWLSDAQLSVCWVIQLEFLNQFFKIIQPQISYMTFLPVSWKNTEKNSGNKSQILQIIFGLVYILHNLNVLDNTKYAHTAIYLAENIIYMSQVWACFCRILVTFGLSDVYCYPTYPLHQLGRIIGSLLYFQLSSTIFDHFQLFFFFTIFNYFQLFLGVLLRQSSPRESMLKWTIYYWHISMSRWLLRLATRFLMYSISCKQFILVK